MGNKKEEITIYFVDKMFGYSTGIRFYLEQLNKKMLMVWLKIGISSLKKAGIFEEDMRIVVLNGGEVRLFGDIKIVKKKLWQILKKSVKK